MTETVKIDGMEPRQRLRQLAEGRGASLSGLSELIGRNSSYLQQFIRKGSPRKLEENDRRVLAQFFDVAESELGGPEDISYNAAQIRSSFQGGAVKTAAGIAAPRSRKDWVDVPRLALDASAGPGVLASDEQAIGAFRFSARWLRDQGFSPGQLSAIAVAGDSMEPLLRDGDEILVERLERPLRDGIHVVRLGDALMVKRVDIGHPGKLVLRSENRAYDPIEAEPDEVDVIGRVVWKSGRL